MFPKQKFRAVELTTAELYAILASITLSPTSARAKFTNWGQTFRCKPLAVFEPVNEIQVTHIIELARREGTTVRAAGAGHSPSDLACTSGFMIRTNHLDKLISVDSEKGVVVVQGGMSLHALHQHLLAHDLAMSNVGSISDQSIAGVVTTATHGSGVSFPVISNYVLALDMIMSDGTPLRCSRELHADIFLASLCGLGATGFVTAVTLQVEPAFRLKERTVAIPFDTVIDRFAEFVRSAEHVRLWWFVQPKKVILAQANRTYEPAKPKHSWFWDTLVAHVFLQFLLFLGIFAPRINYWTSYLYAWLNSTLAERVEDSFAVFNVDCHFPQYTTEWAIPLEEAAACITELNEKLEDEIAKGNGFQPHFPIEIRFTDADDIWLSPSHGRKTCYVGVTQYKPYGFTAPYRRLFEIVEEIAARHKGRSHWAKAHRLRPPTLRQLYPRFDDFASLLERVDPVGMFRNEYVQRHIFGDESVGDRVFKPLV